MPGAPHLRDNGTTLPLWAHFLLITALAIGFYVYLPSFPLHGEDGAWGSARKSLLTAWRGRTSPDWSASRAFPDHGRRDVAARAMSTAVAWVTAHPSIGHYGSLSGALITQEYISARVSGCMTW